MFTFDKTNVIIYLLVDEIYYGTDNPSLNILVLSWFEVPPSR